MRGIILVIMLIVFVSKVSAQTLDDLRINGDYEDRPLHLVLLDLELNYRLEFKFEKDDLRDFRITHSFRRAHLNEVLDILLSGTGFNYKVATGRTISLFRQTAENMVMASQSTVAPTRQKFTASGVIKDAGTGERLPFANVSVYRTSIGNVTNADGYFTLFEVPDDTSVLEVNYLGYQLTYFRLQPDMDMSDLSIEISESGVELQTIVVQANREEQMIKASSGVSTVGLAPQAMSTLPSYGEKDVFRSLQLLPGISGTNESSSGLYVRGGTPDQNLILLDGFTVYHVDHLFGFFSAFNSNAIKDIQLHKGGFEAQYGGRLSSVVDMTGKDGNTEQFNMGAGLSLLSYNGYIEAPFAGGKGSFIVTARRSFQSKFYSSLFDAFTGISESNEQPQRNGPGGGRIPGFGQQEFQPNSYFYDLNTKLTYRFGRKDILSISFYNGEDKLDNSRITNNSFFRGGFGGGNPDFNFNSDNIDLSNWGNVGASLKWSRKWNDFLYSKLTTSYSNYFSTRDRRNQTTVTRNDTTTTRNIGNYENNDLRDFTIKFDNELKLSPTQQIDFGIQSTYNIIEYIYTQNDSTTIIDRDNQGTTSSIYVQDRLSIAERYILKGGLRASHFSVTNGIFLEPRASFSYLIDDKWKAKAAFGKYNQFVSRIVREDIQQGSRDFWVLADDSQIPIGSAIHYIGGVSYENQDWLFDVEAYHKTLDGLSEYSTRITPQGFRPGVGGGGLNYEEFFYNGDGFAQGIEFLVQRKSGNLTGWIGYTLGQVKYNFPDFGDQPFYANQDQTHEVKLVGNYKTGRWNFSGTFIYATGRPYTAPTGYYEIELIDGSSESFFEVSSKNGLRLPDYHRLDLSATY
ncbi:MAG: TonB-dependent receptor, partial [Saprospiraceae bacterium]|nr:TonB-dependent receptor [Saprospiraceae bacterium]